jgi:YbbR domain-containing protein
MKWLLANWRLKLLALVLTVGLLGAVAFSENPVVAVGVPAVVEYDNRPDGAVIVSPVQKTTINLVGLASVTNSLRDPSIPNGVRVGVNLRGVTAADYGKQRTFAATPKTLPSGVTWTGDPMLITVGIDQLQTKDLDIQVRTPHPAPGVKVLDPPQTYAYCDNPAQACRVRVQAPQAVLQDLSAYVQIDASVSGSGDSPSQPVRFEQNGKQVDVSKFSFVPPVSFDPSTVTARVAAQQTQVTRTVALKPNITGRPACGFAVTGITFAPDAFVSITGASDKVAPIDSITLPRTIDITGATSDIRSNQSVPSDGYTPNPNAVTVTVGISKQVDCTAPTPTPTPKTP